MLICSNKIKKYERIFEGMLILLLIIVPLTVLTGSNTPLYENTPYSSDLAVSSQITDARFKVDVEKNYIGNYSFDPESFADYVGSLYDKDEAIFLENVGGYSTSVATYEALASLRIFGLDYYQFGNQWQDYELAIADKLIIDLEDPSESGGFLLTIRGGGKQKKLVGINESLMKLLKRSRRSWFWVIYNCLKILKSRSQHLMSTPKIG